MDLRPTGYKPKKQLLCISVTGNLNTLLYLAELHRHCRGKRNRTSDNGSQSIKRICCKLPSLDASKNTSCCHYTIPQISNCSLTGFEPAPPAFTRVCFRYTKPILRSIVPTHYSPCTAFFFGIVQRQLLTLCRRFRRAGNRNRTDIPGLEGLCTNRCAIPAK